MTTAVVDSPENERVPAGWLPDDTLLVELHCLPEMGGLVIETASPAGSAHLLPEDVFREQRLGQLDARWVPAPRGEQGLICSWVRRDRGNALAPSPIRIRG